MDTALKTKIDQIINQNDVVLFMKGTATQPRCGFSAKVAKILEEYKIKFTDINVLEDSELREGIKQYSEWPTIPQLYIKKEFIGGCDIVSELMQSGELKELLKNCKKNILSENITSEV